MSNIIDLIEHEIEHGSKRSVAALYTICIGGFMKPEGHEAMVRANRAISAKWGIKGLSKIKQIAWNMQKAMTEMEEKI